MSEREFYSLLNLLKILENYCNLNDSLEYKYIIKKLCDTLLEELENECGTT